jgi:hypothetical protein
MNPKAIQTVCQEIYRRYPEFKGARPKVQSQPANSRALSDAATYLLIFQTRVTLADQHTLPHSVRVVASDQGKIIRITTSR